MNLASGYFISFFFYQKSSPLTMDQHNCLSTAYTNMELVWQTDKLFNTPFVYLSPTKSIHIVPHMTSGKRCWEPNSIISFWFSIGVLGNMKSAWLRMQRRVDTRPPHTIVSLPNIITKEATGTTFCLHLGHRDKNIKLVTKLGNYTFAAIAYVPLQGHFPEDNEGLMLM